MTQSSTQEKMVDKMSSSTLSSVSSVKDAAKEGMDKVLSSPIKEGEFTKKVENQTAKIPSISFLSFALGSIALSATLATFRKKDAANFVGLWAPTFLLLGIYNKLVKLEGSDREDLIQKSKQSGSKMSSSKSSGMGNSDKNSDRSFASSSSSH